MGTPRLASRMAQETQRSSLVCLLRYLASLSGCYWQSCDFLSLLSLMVWDIFWKVSELSSLSNISSNCDRQNYNPYSRQILQFKLSLLPCCSQFEQYLNADLYNKRMGASGNKDNSIAMPTQGCRVMQVINPELEGKLQPFTDYIIHPSPQHLKNSIGEIEATVFSTLDFSMRKEVLPISENHFGAKIKVTAINDCSLRVTKVFPNSPCELLGIAVEEYIVGLVEAEFTNLSSFAQALRSIISDQKEVLTLAICSQHGLTRLIPVSVAMIQEWSSNKQSILGCELAEGWMHRFKGRPKRAVSQLPVTAESVSKDEVESKIQEQQEISKIQDLQVGEGSQEWEEIERIVGGQAVGQSLEVTFKGLLKNQYLEDASTICRCKTYNKECEGCWMERDGNHHFFNKKTNRIVTIPANLLLQVPQ